MRRVAIDIREALLPHPAGKGQWVRGFVSELATRELPLCLMGIEGISSPWTGPHIRILQFPRGWRWHLRAARALLREQSHLLFFSPLSFIVPFLSGGSVPTIPLVHDLIAFRGEPHNWKAKLIERCTLRRAVTVACHICTISEATKHDLLNRYSFLSPTKISVIYAGPLTAAPPLAAPDHSTILSVGTLCPRKNQLRLIEAYAALPEDLRRRFSLVLAGGRGWSDAEIIRLARNTPGVEWRGYVSDAEYEALLSRASLLAFPSLYEGFGMPVLDALQRGVPVLTSHRGSLSEVAGEAAQFVDPEDTHSIAKGLENILRDADLCSHLRVAGPMQAQKFSWKRTVDLFLEVIRPLL